MGCFQLLPTGCAVFAAVALAACGQGSESTVGAHGCSDNAQNGDETGIDCGGATCAPCGVSEGCVTASDCASGRCEAQVCVCPAGFTDDGAGACADVDECAEDLDDCDANAACANTDGSFVCACSDGFEGDGTTCTPCAPGTWGAGCAKACAGGGSCFGDITCDPRTGAVTSCSWCEAGSWGATCTDSCENERCSGAITCDQDTGDTTSCEGCVAGYGGDVCDTACDQGHCTGTVTCDQDTGAPSACAGCEAGYYGPGCGETCDPGDCAGTVTCDQVTGEVTGCSGCAAGYYGADCTVACPQGDCVGTVTCDQTAGEAMSCTGCEAGYYGATCADTCDQGDCTGTVTCDQTTGAATSCTGCEPGHTGATCAGACPQGDCVGTVTCDQDTGAAVSCEACEAGTHGATCADACAQGHCVGTVSCDQDTGAALACTGCEAGYRGPTCADTCAQGNCVGTVECAQDTGAIVSCGGCAAGYHGATCSDSCDQGHCAGTVTCDQDTGAASSCVACDPGYHGDTCADACDQGHCVGTVTCDQDTADATACGGCEPGFYGPTCADACDPGDCTGTVTCDQATGAVTGCSGCPAGLWGETCAQSCPQGECTGTVTCDQDTGAALSCAGCAAGFYGTTCTDSCPQGDCTGTVTCDQTTGAALSCTGCAAGSYGATCTETCPQGECTGTVSCDQDTGATISCAGCTPGHHGATCADSCSQGDCVGTVTCDQDTSAAVSCTGCAAGFYGATCGDGCAQGHCVGTVTCDQDTGAATHCDGCVPGYTGTTCAETCAQGACTGTVTCDQDTGAAISCTACQAGAWGPTCDDTCALGNCAGTVTCDQVTGDVLACDSCAGTWAGPTCGWWDPAWTDRVSADLAVTDAPDGATEVQIPVDVDALCYGVTLPPILASYHFDEGTGDAVASSDGHGGFAQLPEGANFVPGVEGSALHLDGVGWVDLQDIAPTDTRLTAAAWVKLDAIPTTSAGPGLLSAWKSAEIFELRVTGDPSVCDVNGGGYGARFMTQVHPIDQGEPNLCSTTELLPNHWYHLALTFDGQVERLYVNGALEASYDYGAPVALRALGSDVRLGTNRDASEVLDGAIDSAVVLDGALDDAGVQALMRPRCRRDLGDLRFYDTDAGTLLPIWTESDARVWLRVPVDIADHAVDLYFGNPLAPDVTDGAAVFELFDAFDDGVDDDTWIADAGCAAAARWGKAAWSPECAALTSVVGFGDTPLSVAVDVTRVGGSTVCYDAAAGWVDAQVSASVGLNSAGSDGVGVGSGAAPTCGDDAFLSSESFDIGTLLLAQPPEGGAYSGAWTPLGEHTATADPVAATGIKGALRLHLAADDSTPVLLDDLRVYVPTTSTVGFGVDDRCVDAVGVTCCGHSDCAADEACQANTCVDRYRWVDYGARDQQPISVTTCTGYFEDAATCDGALFGERVHIADASSGINYRVIGAAGTFGTLPGGKGSDASLSADGQTLTWGGQSSGCVGQHKELVDLTAVWVCEALYCDLDHECVSGVCADHACQPPTCDDGVHNGYESDIDCGGDCAACPVVTVRPGQSALDSDAEATVVFELDVAVDYPISADFTTADGSAVAGVHYVATGGTVVFPSGEQLASATIPLLHGPPTLTTAAADKALVVDVTDVRGGDAGGAEGFALLDSTARVVGVEAGDQIILSRGTARRDIDGDDEPDLLITSVNGDISSVAAGLVYALVGDPTWPGRQIDLADVALDGVSAFGVDRTYRYYDQAGVADVDGDGLGDLLVRSANNVYAIVFGGEQPYAALYDSDTAGVATLTGSGFTNGAYYVAPFDFDADGFDDVFVGGGNSTVYGSTSRGLAAWRGRASWASSQGPDLYTTMAIGHCGVSSRSNSAAVGGAGDFNNDGYLDLTANNGCSNDGQLIPFSTYIVFGNAAFTLPTSLSAVDGSDGVRLTGGNRGPRPSSQQGDFNGDGVDDLLVHDTHQLGGQHVVYGGQPSWAASTALTGSLAASFGFRITGGGLWNAFGGSAGFGDIDGDGFDDLVIPRYGDTGVWILWGRAGLGGTVNLASDPDALALPGVGDLDDAENVELSDVDGDGLADLVISYPSGDALGRSDAGVGLVVFGARLAPGHNPELAVGTPTPTCCRAPRASTTSRPGAGTTWSAGSARATWSTPASATTPCWSRASTSHGSTAAPGWTPWRSPSRARCSTSARSAESASTASRSST